MTNDNVEKEETVSVYNFENGDIKKRLCCVIITEQRFNGKIHVRFM